MLSVTGNSYRPCDGITRREMLRAGALGLGGLSLASLFQLEEAGAVEATGKAISVIILWLSGGPSHFEWLDPKPDAPREIRGEFGSIATSVPGTRISELWPQSARRAHKFSIVRSMAHTHNDHDASQWMLSGYFYTPTAQTIQYPSMGSVFAKLRERAGWFPPNWHMPDYGRFVVNAPEGFGAGYLGRKYDPILVEGDPSQPGFNLRGLATPQELNQVRLARRESLLESVNRSLDEANRSGAIAAMDENYQKAFSLIHSSAVRQAFAIDSEDPRVRDRYGRHRFGQCALVARRLVEVGARFVTLRWPGLGFEWDTHSNNFNAMKQTLCPPVDTAFSALIDDLDSRGLLASTLVLLMGEFGRTPKINPAAGRDHWQQCFSLAAAGAGVPGGQTIGASDSQGAYPRTRSYAPEDLCATVYRKLGIDYDHELYTPQGRPVKILPRGEPIAELMG